MKKDLGSGSGGQNASADADCTWGLLFVERATAGARPSPPRGRTSRSHLCGFVCKVGLVPSFRSFRSPRFKILFFLSLQLIPFVLTLEKQQQFKIRFDR